MVKNDNKESKNEEPTSPEQNLKNTLLPIFHNIIDKLPSEQRQKFRNGEIEKILDIEFVLVERERALDPKERILAKEFLDKAEKELRYAKQAYNQKDYDVSIRNMTTATEGIAKAFGIRFLGLTSNDDKNLGHFSTMAFTTVLDREPFIKIKNIFKDMYSLNLPESDQVNKAIKNLWDNKVAQELTEEQLNSLLNLTDEMKTLFRSELNNKDSNLIGNIQDLIGDILNLIDINKIFNLFDKVFYILDLYIISSIVYPHYKSSQFADNSALKPKDYTTELGIVKVAPRILDKLQRIDKELASLI